MLGVAVFVFLLFPGRRPASEPGADSAPLVQQPSSRSFIAAAPQGYTGWIERQLVLSGRPPGWSVAGILRWKVILGVAGTVIGTLVVVMDPHPFKILLAMAGTLMLFFLPDVRLNSRAHDRQEKIARSLPDTLDQMTIAVEAGLGFDAAMAKAARGGHGPLAEELFACYRT